jgi:hypothetical protein
MPGRPRALCDEKQREICTLVATGCTMADAARYVSCSVLTIRREARRNPKFHEALRRSRVAAEISPLNTMRQAATSEWRAAAWLLERTQPRRFAKRNPHSFSQEEVIDLVGRVCDVVRQETRDVEKFARIKRRVTALTRQLVRPEDNPVRKASSPGLPHPIAAPAVPSAAPAQPAATRPAVPTGVASRSTDQNATEIEPIVICLADIPPGNSSVSQTSDGSK